MEISDVTQLSSFFRVLLNRLPLSHVQEIEPQSSRYFYVCPEDHQESHPPASQVRLVLVSIMSVLVQRSLLGQMHPHRSKIMVQQMNTRDYSVELMLRLGPMRNFCLEFDVVSQIKNPVIKLSWCTMSCLIRIS